MSSPSDRASIARARAMRKKASASAASDDDDLSSDWISSMQPLMLQMPLSMPLSMPMSMSMSMPMSMPVSMPVSMPMQMPMQMPIPVHISRQQLQSDKKRLLISLDVEANGPSPASHCVLSIGLAIADESKWGVGVPTENWLIESHEINVQATKESHKSFEDWISSCDGLAEHLSTDAIEPRSAALQIRDILSRLSAKASLYWICSPSSADWMWLKHFMHENLTEEEMKEVDIGYFAECIKTRMNAMLLLGISSVYLNAFCFTSMLPHTHKARDDAIEQANRFMAQNAIFSAIRTSMSSGWNCILPQVVDQFGNIILPTK